LLEEMRKSRKEDRAVWQREMEEMQWKVNIRWEEDSAVWKREREEFQGQVNTYINRLREEVLASANAKALAKASLEEMRKRSEEKTGKRFRGK
jgi:hypothetical protein